MPHGPVDVLLLAFGEPKFDGSVLGELERLAKAGTIRVLDGLVVMKSADGERIELDIDDLSDQDKAALGFVDTAAHGLFDSDDADMIFEGLTPGSAVMGLAVEHVWAARLREAVEAAGAEVAMTERIPGEAVDAAYAALAASA